MCAHELSVGAGGVVQLGGRPVSKSEQITGRERDRIAAGLRERTDQGATIRDLVTETGRSYGWVRTLLDSITADLRRARLITLQSLVGAMRTWCSSPANWAAVSMLQSLVGAMRTSSPSGCDRYRTCCCNPS